MARIMRVFFRRKREGKTDYKKRLSLLKSGKHRLIVRKSLKNITVQFAAYSGKGDKVAVTVASRDLAKYGYKFSKSNIVAAYLTGMLAGKKASDKGIKEAILDAGLNPSTKGSKIYAVVKGAIDSGLKVPCSQEVLPSDDRIKGAHIKIYADKIKKDDKIYRRQFSSYLKNSMTPEGIMDAFEDAKKAILKK